jgi:hypothetical protein
MINRNYIIKNNIYLFWLFLKYFIINFIFMEVL